MTHRVEYNELIRDLIDARIISVEIESMLSDVLRYGFEGYINIANESLIKEALKINLYGPDVDSIEIL